MRVQLLPPIPIKIFEIYKKIWYNIFVNEREIKIKKCTVSSAGGSKRLLTARSLVQVQDSAPTGRYTFRQSDVAGRKTLVHQDTISPICSQCLQVEVVALCPRVKTLFNKRNLFYTALWCNRLTRYPFKVKSGSSSLPSVTNRFQRPKYTEKSWRLSVGYDSRPRFMVNLKTV